MEPKNAIEYLTLTEPAVSHFYEGIKTCWAIYEEANTYWDISKINEPKTKVYMEKLA